MGYRKFITLPAPTIKACSSLGRGRPSRLKKAASEQQSRLERKLSALEHTFQRKEAKLQRTASGPPPEDVLVLETVGTVDRFLNAIGKIDGLEYLLEEDVISLAEDDDFFEQDDPETQDYHGKAYLAFSNRKAFEEILRLWQLWLRSEKLDYGLGKWKEAFGLLRDIRVWSASDRIDETGIKAHWSQRLDSSHAQIPCELELWCRLDADARIRAEAKVTSLVEQYGGKVFSNCIVPEIRYHAISITLPSQLIESFLELGSQVAPEHPLLECTQIQYFRATGQTRVSLRSDGSTGASEHAQEHAVPTSPAAVALLDGLPLQRHVLLKDRLYVDDPEGLEESYSAASRRHGTAMASLIIWGDLNTRQQPIPQKLYSRPILEPHETDPETEQVPDATLLVDKVHKCVQRIVALNAEGVTQISTINLSIGIADRPFDGALSPLARLIDWLSWKHNILFIVSAGNTNTPFNLNTQVSQLSAEELQGKIITNIDSNIRHRKLLSPAEAINCLTIGAQHDDTSPYGGRAGLVSPTTRGYPSPISRVGLGFRRAIKPDLLVPGGRVMYLEPLRASDTSLTLPRVACQPGQLVASPGSAPGSLVEQTPSHGTSNAAALTTRTAAFLTPIVTKLQNSHTSGSLSKIPTATILKALLVHAARWNDAKSFYQSLLCKDEPLPRTHNHLCRYLGYGNADFDALLHHTNHSAVAISGGILAEKGGHTHKFPLPPSLSGKPGLRTLIVTLAWNTPVFHKNSRWREARLWYDTPTSHNGSVTSDIKRDNRNWQSTRRGTVQHEVFSGEAIAAFRKGDNIEIHVNCRGDGLPLRETVAYSLVVSLTVGSEMGIDVFSEVSEIVKSRLAQPAPPAPAV